MLINGETITFDETDRDKLCQSHIDEGRITPFDLYFIQTKRGLRNDEELLAALQFAVYRGPAMLSIPAEMEWLRLHRLCSKPLEEALTEEQSVVEAEVLEDYKTSLCMAAMARVDVSKRWGAMPSLPEMGDGLALYAFFSLGAARVCVHQGHVAAVCLNPRHPYAGFDDLDVIKLEVNVAYTLYLPDYLYEKIFRMRKALAVEAGLVDIKDVKHFKPDNEFGFTGHQLNELRGVNDAMKAITGEDKDHFVVDVPKSKKYAKCRLTVDANGVERLIQLVKKDPSQWGSLVEAPIQHGVPSTLQAAQVGLKDLVLE